MRHVTLFIIILANVIGMSAVATLSTAALPDAQTMYNDPNHKLYLPSVTVPEPPPPPPPPPPPANQYLKNRSFEDGWTDVTGSIQKPKSWQIDWVPPGQTIYGFPEQASADPEFTHKLAWQLPPEERPGEPGALILHGETVYKIFHRDRPFGGEMRQTVSGLPPGQRVRLTVPILLDPQNESYEYAAASGVWINGIGNGDGWAWLKDMGDRTWYYHFLETTVPSNGQVQVLIRVFSKYQGVDYFIDDLRLEVIN